MLFLLFLLVSLPVIIITREDLGDDLVPLLRSDLDLPLDEEYEDLRSEFLAYRTFLDYIKKSRRSLISTPCLQAGGICIHVDLCPGFRQLAEVPGCKSHKKVCCFVWNIYNVRDHRNKGVLGVGFPWHTADQKFGGKGVEVREIHKLKKKKVVDSYFGDFDEKK
ncbi:uncharacterized protein LOC121729377 [Aricia agestis]|uniref:uncharacterized protein LOC121729377 n=1 Tax=Aricia agestis TaxID=91739 RepID=UPI001C2070DC|nr:uncharacterized protein LOC121729377 [Aricia agestis]